MVSKRLLSSPLNTAKQLKTITLEMKIDTVKKKEGGERTEEKT